MQLNTRCIVWLHVLKYLEVRLSEDTPGEIGLKRRTMLAIALTCRNVVEMALSRLWKSTETLEPVSLVFNTSLSSAAHRHQSSRCWGFELLTIRDLRTSVPRAKFYLSRIRFLHLSTFTCSKELSSWLSLLGPGCLCPNLEGLFLDLKQCILDSIYTLCPLLTPSLKTVTFSNAYGASREATASAIIAMLVVLKAQIEVISYHGFASARIFHHIFDFPLLRSVAINPDSEYNPVLDSSQVEALQIPVQLTKLDINLNVIAIRARPAFGRWLASLRSLDVLHVSGCWKGIRSCVFDALQKCLSLHRLSVSFHFLSNPPMADRVDTLLLFRFISSTFPNLRSLRIDSGNYAHRAWMTNIFVKEILDLGGCRFIESLDLQSIPTALSTPDVDLIVDRLRSLKHLSIKTVSHVLEPVEPSSPIELR